MALATDPQALSDQIDSLLVRYLALLDEYTSLRGSRGLLQSSIYTNIARANFQAERGVSYGREAYDRRAMLPTRLCTVMGDAEDGTAVFEIGEVAASAQNKAEAAEGRDGNIPSQTEDIEEGMEKVNIRTESSQDIPEDKEGESPPKLPSPPSQPTKSPDPIRMFGFSIPSALRTAQSSSIQLVETSIPRLASISLQMRALEIQIRRARKYRAKALVAEGEKERGGVKEGLVA